ncbi:MAG: ABC transporter permease [Chloroflexi bacterium HGW-Chloroflexi-1]|nr:MAG: ABC transporter permease [Chloroflexi bacterium HGW-Chloroflexi-1]
MNRLWTITRKEFIHIIRDPRTLILVIILPVMMLALLGSAFANEIEHLPMAVADQSKTDASRRFVDRFSASGFFDVTYGVQSEGEIQQLMDQGLVKSGLLIPEEFGRNLSTGNPSAAQFYVDGADPLVAQTAQLAIETISQATSQEILVQQLSSGPFPMELRLPIDSHVRFLYNPNLRRMNFLIPGLIALILQVQALLLTAFAIVREREQGTLEQLIVTPLRPWELMLGKILPFILVAMVNIAMTVAVGHLWFGVEVAGSVTLLFVLSLVFLSSALGLGVLISTISRNQMQAMYMSTFIILPAVMLSGLIFPRENMPRLVYWAGYLMPVTHFLEVIRGIILKGVGINYLWQNVWPLVIFGVVVFLASVLLFHKRL